jgi:hypothetical protein
MFCSRTRKSVNTRLGFVTGDKVTGETGSVLIPLALMLLVLMGVIFTAIDVGHYYLARAKLQASTDAVLINAMRMIAKSPEQAQLGDNEKNIRLVAQQIAIDNLLPSLAELSIEPWAPGTYPVEITEILYNPIKITVTGQLKVNTWLVGALPGFQSVFVASSNADGAMEFSSVGERTPLVVAVLIDRSRSMRGGINKNRCTDCTVAHNHQFSESQSWYARFLGDLDTALVNPAHADSIIRGDAPTTPVPTPNPTPDSSATPVATATPSATADPLATAVPTPTPCAELPTPGSKCNTPTKFAHAKKAALDLIDALDGEYDELIVKAFSSEVTHIDKNSEDPDFDTNIKNIRTAIKEMTADGGTNMAGALQAAHDDFKALIEAKAELSDARFLVVVITDGNPMSGEFAPCPTNLSNSTRYDVAPWMIKALQISDIMRTEQYATIYTLGIGVEAAESLTDPYQGRFNGTLLKPYFLRRLANDHSSPSDPEFNPLGCPDDFNDSLESYSSLESEDAPVGRYFKIDASNINTVVQAIGEDKLMKVVE